MESNKLVFDILTANIINDREGQSPDFAALVNAAERVTQLQNFIVEYTKRVAQQKAINEIEERSEAAEFANVNLDDFVASMELRGSMVELLAHGRNLLLESLNDFDFDEVKQAVKGVQI